MSDTKLFKDSPMMEQRSKSFSLGTKVSVGQSNTAFTLIELIIVIAIIAILAAIIFPVFGIAEENARENNTMSNLHDIQEGLALYKLDNKSYPPVLFAYACDTAANAADQCSVTDSMQTIAADKHATNELVGLYPEYVKSWQSFECENDSLNDPKGAQCTTSTGSDCSTAGGAGTQPQPNYLCQDGSLNKATASGTTSLTVTGTCNTPYRSFFKRDAMDIGPEVSGQSSLTGGAGNYTYVMRYQTSWTSWLGFFNPDDVSPTINGASNPNYYGNGSPWVNYPRQLMWQNPPADTYVTVVTDHVAPANKVIVLYESGSAVKKDMTLGAPPTGFNETTDGTITPFAPGGTLPDGSACMTQPTGGVSSAPCSYAQPQFWQINTTGH